MRPLVMVLKVFLQARRLNSLYTGGMPSFALCLLVVSCLQFFPQEEDLGLSLQSFLQLYGACSHTHSLGSCNIHSHDITPV